MTMTPTQFRKMTHIPWNRACMLTATKQSPNGIAPLTTGLVGRDHRPFSALYLVTLQVLPFQEIIVGKSSHGGPIDYIQFEKNRLKFSVLLYKVM